MALAGASPGYITYSAVFIAAFGAGTLAMIMASYTAG